MEVLQQPIVTATLYRPAGNPNGIQYQPAGLDLITLTLAYLVLKSGTLLFGFVYQKNLIILVWQRQDDVPDDIGMESMNSWLVCSARQET